MTNSVDTTDADPQARWDDMKLYGPYARTLTRWIHKLLDPLSFSSVVDVGCGRGHTLERLTQRYPSINRVAGIDLSTASLSAAKARVGQGEFHQLDIQTAHLPEQFDLVICTEVMELLVNDIQALIHMRKMTAKYILITAMQGHTLPPWQARIGGQVRHYQHGELAAKVQQAGFTLIRCVEWGFPFYSPLYRLALNLTDGRGRDGQYGLGRKMLSEAIYRLFFLNSARRGKIIFIVAAPR